VVASSFGMHSDDHIFDIMRAKFTSYSDFHTKMYMKQKEYLALHNDDETMRDVTASYIAQTCLGIAAVILLLILSGRELSGTITYHWLQYMAATIKAGLIVLLYHRSDTLTLLITRSVGVDASEAILDALQCNHCFSVVEPGGVWHQRLVSIVVAVRIIGTICLVPRCLIVYVLLRVPKDKRRYVTWAALIILVALMSQWALPRLKALYDEEKEWHHEDLQTTMTWIKKNTPPKAVFSTDMGHASNIVCSTGRRVTNHPHYESEDIRNRTELVYRMYECRPVSEVYSNFKELGTDYVLVFHIACKDSRMREAGCAYENRACYKMEHDPAAKQSALFCSLALLGLAAHPTSF